MSKYLTNRAFAGKRAKVGMIVIVAQPRHDGGPGTCLKVGIVRAVSIVDDAPYIRLLDESEYQCLGKIPFYDIVLVGDMPLLPLGTWTWPL